MYTYIDVLHTLLVYSYIFLMWSPQAVGWRPAGHHFYDASCSWSSGADKLFLERNASVTMCSLQFVMPMHLLCSTIYIYTSVCALAGRLYHNCFDKVCAYKRKCTKAF